MSVENTSYLCIWKQVVEVSAKILFNLPAWKKWQTGKRKHVQDCVSKRFWCLIEEELEFYQYVNYEKVTFGLHLCNIVRLL